MWRTFQKLAAFSGVLCSAWFSCANASAATYTNPVTVPNEVPADGIGDPFILKYNGTFYLYSSNGGTLGFKYWTSPDCVNWTYGGLDCTDPLTIDGYAPEVVYWNGTFYMYSSPGGNGHYVFTSTSAGGPFVRATGNLGHSIDGDVFIDDDGSWYFFNAGGDGIHGSHMSSPTSLGGEVVLPGSQISGQWTEGPTSFKRNGKYYLTDTGNHVLSNGYRVNAASATAGPLGPFTPSNVNPILLSSEGPHVGLGHNSVFIGPDLDTYYAVYHSLTSAMDGHPVRKLNFDAIGWNGDKLIPYGPTNWPMQTPALPDFEDRFQRTSIGTGYTNVGGGTWGIANQFLAQSALSGTTPSLEIANTFTTASDYTAEYNVVETARGTTAPQCGAVFGYTDAQNYGYAVLNGVTNQLRTNLSVGGVWGTEVSSPLPAGFDSTKLHTLRIEKSGTTYKFFVDKLLKETKVGAGLGAGHVGYLSADDTANFGYIAASNRVGGSGIFDFHKPIPGTISAVHYNSGGEGAGFHDTSPGNTGGKYVRNDDVDIRDCSEGGENIGWNTTGEWYKYNVDVESSGTYSLGVRYATTFDTCQVRVWLDSTDVTGTIALPNTNGFDNWQTYTIKGVNLTAGNHTLKVETVTGEFDFYRLEFVHSDVAAIDTGDLFTGVFSSGWNFSGGNWSIINDAANINDTGKRTFGSTGWSDYTVECDVNGDNGLNSGLILRVQNPAQGGAGNDANLGTDFYQGYFVGLSTGGLVLGKQNYDWNALATVPGTYALKTWIHLKAVVSGNNIKVYVANSNTPSIDYTDNANPFINGKVGIRSHHAIANFDNFKVSGAATPPLVIPIDPGDAGVDASAPSDASVPGDASPPSDASTPGDAGKLVDASMPADAGLPGDASMGGGSAQTTPVGSKSSCGCRAVGDSKTDPANWGWALFALATIAARGRRRRAHGSVT